MNSSVHTGTQILETYHFPTQKPFNVKPQNLHEKTTTMHGTPTSSRKPKGAGPHSPNFSIAQRLYSNCTRLSSTIFVRTATMRHLLPLSVACISGPLSGICRVLRDFLVCSEVITVLHKCNHYTCATNSLLLSCSHIETVSYSFNYFLPLALDFIITIFRFFDYLPADMPHSVCLRIYLGQPHLRVLTIPLYRASESTL